MRIRSDVDALPNCDWMIDAAANPSVLAGVDGKSSSRQLSEHNLAGTLNLLEYCREQNSGLALLSTSRVYSIRAMASLPLRVEGNAFALQGTSRLPAGVSEHGLSESFPRKRRFLFTERQSWHQKQWRQSMATFGFPVWINRCGVLAGAGQFGTAEQGIFSYWLHAHATRHALR